MKGFHIAGYLRLMIGSISGSLNLVRVKSL